MQPNDKGRSDSAASGINKKGKRVPLVAAVLVAMATFGVGVRIGDGTISLNPANKNSSNLPANLDYSSVDDVYSTLRKEYDGKLDQDKLLDGMKKGLAEATGDPYTEYFTAEEYEKFDAQLNGTGFSGIGAELGLDEDKNLIVVSPISGMPADKAGLKAKDIIAEIDGKDTTGFSIDEAVTKIRGKKGTEVSLKIIRDRKETLDIKITRDDIKIPSVEAKQLDDGTGYMRISTFGDNTGELAAEKAKELKNKGVKTMVLDLRGNPGGVVDSAIEVASLWLPKGTLIMQEKRDTTIVKTYTANGNNVFDGIKTVVLIDGGSASASEIVAGALHDNKAASLVGEKSYGKGVVQGIEPLQDGGELKVTVASWYRPNGQNINKKGIEPDTKSEISDADAAASKDTQLEAAQALLNK